MRGVYFRTEKDGTPLATPELRISATNNRTVYYDDATARDAAMQAGEIKEGSIVLTGYADGEAEVVIKQQPDWDNAVQLTTAQINVGYIVPDDGLIVGNVRPGTVGDLYIKVNGITVGKAVESSSPSYVDRLNVQCIVNKGDVLTVTTNVNAQTVVSFVPFKTVAEPVVMPVNINANPAVPDYSRAVAIDLSTLHTTGYTVPADGYLVGNFWSNSTTAVNYMYVNSNIVAVATWTSGVGHMRGMLQCPVAKNNVLTCDAAINTSGSIKFVPFKS